MLKIEVNTIYYYKKRYHHNAIKEKKTFPDIEDGVNYFKEYNPGYYENIKDFSIYEELNMYQLTDYGVKRYYKKIDPVTKMIESNYNIKD